MNKIRNKYVHKTIFTSEFKPTKCGRPQGSILGPILFLIFINYPPDQIQSDTFMFADDTSLMLTLSNPYADIQLTNAN